MVWETDSTAVRAVLYAVSFAGWGLVLLSTFAIDHADMFGLSQVQRRHAGSPPAAPTLATPLLYRVVRHPLYLGFLVAFWVAPTMSAGRLLFAAAMTGYVLMAVQFEERDLVGAFGDDYRAYRRRTPGLIPRLPKRRHTTNGGDMGRTTTLTSVGEGLDEIRGLAPDGINWGWMGRMADPGELAARLTNELDERLAAADQALASGYPGERPGRQPVHTVYVPADRYTADLVPAYGRAALTVLDEHAAAFATLVHDDDLVTRVLAKLANEPVEDLRVDFEDGYVGKSDADEDADVVRAATALAESQQAGAAAPFGGIRIKCFEAPTRSRAIRTLTSYVATLQSSTAGASTAGW